MVLNAEVGVSTPVPNPKKPRIPCLVCGKEPKRFGSRCGSPIPLEVDHIDGNSKNNAEDNLRWICLNCHAQTPTWKAKNRGRGRASRLERYHNGMSY